MAPNELQSEPADTLQNVRIAAPQTPLATDTEPDAEDGQPDHDLFHKLTKRAKRARNRRLQVGIALNILVVAITFWFMCSLPVRTWGALPLVILPVPLVFIWGAFALSKTLTEDPPLSGASLAHSDGTKAIPSLFAASRANTPILQIRASRAALTLLLPRIRAKDAYLLTGDARRTINRWLRGVSDYPVISEDFDALRIAALKALAHAGDSSAIPAVTQLTAMMPRTTSEALLKQAAIECLPALKARCGEDDAKRTLLRASQPEHTDPDTLLRPASGSGQTDAAELLHGSNSPLPETAPPPGQE